jgi:predicted peroxiredoxin
VRRVQGLSIVVATADPARFHSALELAAANAALDKPTRIFLQAQAVPLLWEEAEAADGMPSASEMLVEAVALGVRISACQSGLALGGREASALPRGVETEGLLSFLAARGDDQLLVV